MNRRELSASRSPSIAHFSETAQGASTIRSFTREGPFAERFNELDRYYLGRRWRTVRSVVLFSWQNNILTSLLFLAAGIEAWYLLQTQRVSVGSVGVAFSFITLSGNTVLTFFEWLAQVEEALIGVERLNGLLMAPLEPGAQLPSTAAFSTGHPRRSTSTAQVGGFPSSAARGGSVGTSTAQVGAFGTSTDAILLNRPHVQIEFDRVCFRYDQELPWVFQDFNLRIGAGEKVGVVGRTGSGKSSLTQILLRLYPLQSGRILIDGVPAVAPSESSGIDLMTYRRLFSFISQDPVLFRSSLRDNLDFERLHEDSSILAVMQMVGLEEWSSPEALQLQIEERGRNVSYGEKQLICLARALLRNSPVVIMDEATSAVDPQSEEILVRATHQFFSGKTQIIIAHRLSTLESCDRILWLRQGRLVGDGPPREILSRFSKSDLSLI
ncbi:MAG: hypothetical protein C5B49_16030 [Bdellovibrio sp.]|nr:MAG: hypothetical protein C5B49_16030 [Bdellovibrio sp.]